MHFVTRGHFWIRDKDGGYTSIRRIRKPQATRKPDGSVFYRTRAGLLVIGLALRTINVFFVPAFSAPLKQTSTYTKLK